MATARFIARLHVLIWALIYGGLLCAVLGLASRPSAPLAGLVLMIVGAVVCAAGIVLIWVRARMAPPS